MENYLIITDAVNELLYMLHVVILKIGDFHECCAFQITLYFLTKPADNFTLLSPISPIWIHLDFLCSYSRLLKLSSSILCAMELHVKTDNHWTQRLNFFLISDNIQV